MGLHEYNVTEKGMPTVLLLSDEDAKAAGLTAKDRVADSAPAAVSTPSTATDPVELVDDDGEPVAPLTAAEVVSLRELLARVAEADEADDDPGEGDDPDEEEEDVDDTAKTPEKPADEKPADEKPAEKAAATPRNKQARPAADKSGTPEATK